MSAVAGIYRRDGEAPELVGLRPMARALGHRGPDGIDVVVSPPAALCHLHLWATPEEAGERQPLADAAGRCLLALDGRLDNRAELVERLRPRLGGVANPSDARLALEAYLEWGEEMLGRLLGSFALVVADCRRRTVLCARDPVGNRTLFYRLDPRRLLVASEEAALLAHPKVSARLDEERVAHYFGLTMPEDGSTFFAEVRELLPGQALRVGEESCLSWRFWEPDPALWVQLESDEEYAERYRELLDEAIACRLRAVGPPAVMMSGGIDSTSLAALAAERVESGSAEGPLRAISWTFDRLAACDERAHIRLMLQRYPIRPEQVSGDEAWPLCTAGSWGVNPNTPEDNPYRELKRLAYEKAAANGSRVLLNGGSADLLYRGGEAWLRDLLLEGRVLPAAADLLRELRRRGLRQGLRRSGVNRALFGAAGSAGPESRAEWLSGHARALMGSSAGPAAAGRRPKQWAAVLGPRESRGISIEAFHTSRAGVELRHPYRDRRLIEFMLAVPAHQLYARNRYKHIARNAMEGRLPEAIRSREQPSLLSPLFRRGIFQEERVKVDKLLDDSDAFWARYVRREWLSEVRARPERRPLGEVVLWNCVAFELWARQGAGRAAAGSLPAFEGTRAAGAGA